MREETPTIGKSEELIRTLVIQRAKLCVSNWVTSEDAFRVDEQVSYYEFSCTGMEEPQKMQNTEDDRARRSRPASGIVEE